MAKDSFRLRIQFRRDFGHESLPRAIFKTLKSDLRYFLYELWHYWIRRESREQALHLESFRNSIPLVYCTQGVQPCGHVIVQDAYGERHYPPNGGLSVKCEASNV